MKGRILTLAAVGAIVALAAFGGYRWTSATGPDVNNDGNVTGLDFFAVLKAFGSTVPTPPPVVGNRALVTVNNFGGVVLYDTSDGSQVAVVTGGATGYGPSLTSAVVGTSCNGAYGAAAEAVDGSTHRVRIVSTLDGAVRATANVGTPFGLHAFGQFEPARVLFPCLLKGAGGLFDSGGPTPNRAAVLTATSPCCAVTLYDLTSGQVLFSDTTTGGFWFNCAQDTLMYGIASNAATNLVRLSDGGLIGSMPGYPNVKPTC